MKAPLRATDSSTIEKLRAWLAAELEPLEIDNNVQYAHHVVTIFLNDADVEDEPLSPPDDFYFLRELDNLRAGKSLDQKKRAAVQFLKGVIPLEKQPIPCLIGQLIDELVVRVESTKVRIPRRLLGPIGINVESSRKQTSYRKYKIGQERCYDEAFPSLPAEVKMNAVTVTVKKGACADGWHRSSTSNDQRNRRKAARKITFVDKSEDAVCSRTGLLHLIPVTDSSSSPTIEVDGSSLEVGMFSGGVLRQQFESEWKSAFQKVCPTAKLYAPKRIYFPLPLDVSSPARPNSWSLITVIYNAESGQSTDVLQLADKVNLLDEASPKAFLHIEQKAPELPRNTLFALDADDLEVSNSISWKILDKKKTDELKTEMKKHDRQRQRDRIRHRNNSPTTSGVHGPSMGSAQSNSMEGAVGGSEEVKTDDLCAFAMEQIQRSGGRRAAFDVVLPDSNENKLSIYIGMDGCGKWQNGVRGSADSGMCPGGEEESRINLFGWADGVGSPSGWLEPASVWRKAAQSNDLSKWRKTPGCADDGSAGSSAASALPMEKSTGYDEVDSYKWTGRADPISDPDCSWDSIRRDIFRLSPFPPDDATSDTEPDIYSPPEVSFDLDQNVKSILNSAFSSMSATGTASNQVAQIQPSSPKVLDCSELEHRWLSHRSEDTFHQERLPVVRGRTCSNWLEGVCQLGKECPFSHPRI